MIAAAVTLPGVLVTAAVTACYSVRDIEVFVTAFVVMSVPLIGGATVVICFLWGADKHP